MIMSVHIAEICTWSIGPTAD